MADIEVEATGPTAIQSPQMAKDFTSQAHPESAGNFIKKIEQVTRGVRIEDSPEPIVLDDRLRTLPKMPEVGEADAVDAGG